ncbi:SCO2521 family protein [Nocardia suismassiliense]|uniref:SCO2521 family protein n=1 Tax=Nocardia suismassiliense TaxID=2077092 RepID=UPI000D1E7F98|nr:SCO2521 family protein [Nocardia suismassiliense]
MHQTNDPADHRLPVVLGETHTCLLPTAKPLRRSNLEQLLDLMPGHPVHWRERPLSRAVSPDLVTGVDCELAAPGHAAVRAIGTVANHAVVLGGRVLQSSAQAKVVVAERPERQVWSHYLSRAGVLEVLTKVTTETSSRLTNGLLADGPPTPGVLDLASIAHRLLGRITMDPHLDQGAPLRSGTTHLRWAARVGDVEQAQVAFRVLNDTDRTAEITVRGANELAAAQQFCEDLAAHDWLLTVLRATLEKSDLFYPGTPESTALLAPALHHLAHLWAPGAHTPAPLRALWAPLEADPGFTADRQILVDELRNRVLVSALDAKRQTTIGTDL